MRRFCQLCSLNSKKALACTAIFVSVLVFAGCKRSDNPQSASAISLIHASPGLEGIDFYIDIDRVQGSRPIYYMDSVRYLVYDQEYSYWVKRNSSAHTYVYGTLPAPAGKFYTLFITGKPDTVKSLLTEDDLSVPEAGKAKIRFINLCPDASLDVEIGDEKLMNRAFMSHTSFITINPAIYSVTFSKPGATEKLTHTNLNVEAGKIYTLIAKGLTNSDVDSLMLGVKLITY